MSGTKAKRTAAEKMLNEARREMMVDFEERYAEPPPYTPQARFNGSAVGGSTQMFDNLDFKPSPLEIPTPAECIIHLKLLYAFAKLRHDVGNHESLFGICMDKVGDHKTLSNQLDHLSLGTNEKQPIGVHNHAPGSASGANAESSSAGVKDSGLAERIRDKRWAVFVTMAVSRFELWWESLATTSAAFPSPIRIAHFQSNSLGLAPVQRFTSEGDGGDLDANFNLPPLDVLMVWHAHMLNPRIYLEDCIRYTKHELWRTSFPWQLINQSIDSRTFDYLPSNTTEFQELLGRPWDALKDDNLKKIKCPQCTSVIHVPWTRPPASCANAALEDYLLIDTGFAGQLFQLSCSSCSLIVTHDKLRVGKFIDDAAAVLEQQRPLAGTILNIWGTPGVTEKGKFIGSHDAFFPNRVIESLAEFKPHRLREEMRTLTMDVLKQKFTKLMHSSSDIMYVNSQQSKREFVAKSSRIAVRKVLSHYWDNSSIFGIDLVGAVLRQGTFVQKMRKLDWLHSPSLMSTVQRLIVKYHRFVRLTADSFGQTVVPTLDVDLGWHTQQLSPKVYLSYTLAETKKFLNHDDKIPETQLHTAFQRTSQTYEKKYGQPYSECSCWYCECTREPLRSNFLSKIGSRRSSLNVDKLSEKGFTQDAHTGPHISAHNAFPVSDAKTAAVKRRELEELDLQYAKVVKRYQKQKGAQPPKKENNDGFVYGAYGYPMYYPMPVYVPYYSDPGVQEQVPHSSGSSGGGGSGGCGSGGCVAATCCESTSWGACAGAQGTPGCASSCGGGGNAAGGCGSCSSGGGGDGGGGGCGGGGD